MSRLLLLYAVNASRRFHNLLHAPLGCFLFWGKWLAAGRHFFRPGSHDLSQHPRQESVHCSTSAFIMSRSILREILATLGRDDAVKKLW